MSNTEFRDALWIRLDLSGPVGHSECSSSPTADPIGVHRLGCRNAAGLRTRRHDKIVTVLAAAALDADLRAFRVAREERLAEACSSRARPGDVALDLGSGRTLVDVTVKSPFAKAGHTSARFAGSPAAAAATAYDSKINKWRTLLANNHLEDDEVSSSFQPLVVTALGVWDECSLLWLKRFSDACAIARGTDKCTGFSQLMTRLSIALWKDNSRLMRALRVSSDPKPAAGQDDECDFDPADCHTGPI